MGGFDVKEGKAELRAALRRCRGLLLAVGVFSFFANLLLLTGPLYMMQVYDRVLASGSIPTLVTLSLLMIFLFGVMGVLDHVRGRVLARIGDALFQRLKARVFRADLDMARRGASGGTETGLAQLHAVQRWIMSPGFAAVFDVPWVPVFLFGIFLFHPLMGLLAVFGAVVLVMMVALNQLVARHARASAGAAQARADAMLAQMHGQADVLRGLGMEETAYSLWSTQQQRSSDRDLKAADGIGALSAATRAFRLALQSAMLGLGAYLVIGGAMTPGGMIAGSVLLGRALSPIETLLGQWSLVQHGGASWTALGQLLSRHPERPPHLALPRPAAQLSVENLTIVPPGTKTAVLKAVSFQVRPGEAVGVIGPSGAGKSTLARALVGLWPAAGGHLRLGGAALAHYGPTAIGRHIGYLPQDVHLLDGTLAQNIARFQPDASDAAIVSAATRAGAHEMIASLPQGYDTQVRAGRTALSGGQLQRIGLARALYGDPVLLLLDEPNAHLDSAGSEALNAAIRGVKSAGGAALVMTHRPAAIRDCDMLLMLDGGRRMAFGPRDEVLTGMVRNADAVRAVPARRTAAG